tara:strand:+ start:508 stop:909 length:402 start_codon:yes stop_codon:yes gene_type:complete
MKLSKQGIDLGIVTRDAVTMLKFYQDTLGLPLEVTIPMPGGGTMHRLKVGESIVKIIETDPSPSADAIPGGIRAATGYRYWTLTIEALADCVARCEAAGYKTVVPFKTIRPGVSIAIIADPDGNWVELLENAH